MCLISVVSDQFTKTIPQTYPQFVHANPAVSQIELAELRHEMKELKTLLLAAKAYDAATGQPECETEEKVALIKRLADLVGVDMADVFGVTE